MVYKYSDFMNFNQQEFFDVFNGKKVAVSAKDKKTYRGIITEIGIASNSNPQTKEQLPCSIKVDGINIFLSDMLKIEIYE